GVRTRTVAVEHAYAAQHRALRYTVGRTTNGSGHVRAVAVAIRAAAAECVKHVGSTPAKLRVSGTDAGVDHVSANARAGPVVSVGRAQRPVALVDAVEAPRWIALRGIGSDDSVFLDKLDSEVLAQCFSVFSAHLDRKAVKRVLIDVLEVAAM